MKLKHWSSYSITFSATKTCLLDNFIRATYGSNTTNFSFPCKELNLRDKADTLLGDFRPLLVLLMSFFLTQQVILSIKKVRVTTTWKSIKTIHFHLIQLHYRKIHIIYKMTVAKLNILTKININLALNIQNNLITNIKQSNNKYSKNKIELPRIMIQHIADQNIKSNFHIHQYTYRKSQLISTFWSWFYLTRTLNPTKLPIFSQHISTSISITNQSTTYFLLNKNYKKLKPQLVSRLVFLTGQLGYSN